MFDTTGATLSSLDSPGRPQDERLVEALESRLADDERVVSRLTSSGTVTRETDEETVELGGGEGGVLFVATDRKLVFVVDTPTGRQTAVVPYTDLKDATVDGGLLSTTLTVVVWGRGRFGFSPSDATDTENTVDYLTTASDAWQRVVAALQDTKQHAAVAGEAIEEGRRSDATEALESARDCIETARERAGEAPDPLADALSERIEAARTDVQRTRAESLLRRGKALAAASTPASRTGDYDERHADLRQARTQFERAHRIATREGFEEATEARAKRATVAERIAALERQPLARAEQARRRAQRATTIDAAIERWEVTLDRYRDALVAGWGTGADFDGDTDVLRMQIEWVVATLVDRRRTRARQLESTADDLVWDDPETGRERYEAARDHLAAALQLARTYRAGDVRALEDRLETVDSKRAAV